MSQSQSQSEGNMKQDGKGDAIDYKHTLNLPATDFPMKAKLPQQEPRRLQKWHDMNLYNEVQKRRVNAETYVLHDGPPYANGELHIGHALNKILKDFVVKHKVLSGYRSPYIPGWDCHGLPIELQVEKSLKKPKNTYSASEIRKMCRDYAAKYIDIQRETFKRFGVLGRFETPYVTMDPDYEAAILKNMYGFYNKGNLYRGLRPVHWCSSCQTALAEAEVEYANHTSESVYIKFAIDADSLTKLGLQEHTSTGVYAIIWTTTPWTLPANVAIAFKDNLDYAVLKVGASNNPNLTQGTIVIAAESLASSLAEVFDVESLTTITTIKGSMFQDIEAKHPFYNRMSRGIVADHVTDESGSGIVHTAPGHGMDDYEAARIHGLEVLSPVGGSGVYHKDLEIFGGMHINKANMLIVEHMDKNGSLVRHAKINHSYPHCWRCHKPINFRSTPQWFISMDKNNFRNDALEAIKKVEWRPSWGDVRLGTMVQGRPDWCVSRQRVWGVPIALFTCDDCGEVHMTPDLQEKILDEFRKHSSDIWYDKEASYFLGDGYKCGCGSTNVSKEMDILDVWFESGASYAAVSESQDEFNMEDIKLYLEGSDQYRGWFQSSLLESVLLEGRVPYETVITHGFTLDGKGKKMSKSMGNVIDPKEVIERYGADILRLWVASEDYSEDLPISDEILKRVAESYRKIRNTYKFILGNLGDFNPDTDTLQYDSLMEMDKYILNRWEATKQRIQKAYDDHQYHTFYHTFMNFCIRDLSAFYLDILKDRLYTEAKTGTKRRSAQTALWHILKESTILVSTVLSFTADEVWDSMANFNGKTKSVFLNDMPENKEYNDDELVAKWDKIVALKSNVSKALEIARRNGVANFSLATEITIDHNDNAILQIDEDLRRIFIVSKVTIGNGTLGDDATYTTEDGATKIDVVKSEMTKCPRCWAHNNDNTGHDDDPDLCSRCVEVVVGS